MEGLREERIAIVTGASRRAGIGAAICRALAKEGVSIMFTYWKEYDRQMDWGADEEGPEELKKEIISLGVKCESLEIDLSQTDSYKIILDEAENKLGAPSILVNNAAYSVKDGYKGLTTKILDDHYAVNMRSTFLLSTEFAKRFKTGKGGRIINLTSGQSLGAMIEELAYATTKGAIEIFTKTLAADVASLGITVNAINPGPTDTGWMTDELKRELLPLFPQGRIGKPDDAANLVAFLVSEKAEWITGQVIHSEGGFIR